MNRPAFTLKRSRLAQTLALALTLPLTAAAFAQSTEQSEEEQSSEEAQELDSIVVVGSRIKKSEVEGPTPVTIITRENIEAEGYRTVYDALQSLAQNVGFGQNELIQSGFTPNAQVINLRSLGPGRVLTLINGRRVADYPLPYNGQSNFANLASIPQAAIERIEVLSGGASAIYGSDAVAGVINVVLRTNYEGDALKLSAGVPTEGGDETVAAEWVGGRASDRWSLTYAVSYFQRGAIYASERDFMDSYRDNPSTANPTPVEGIRLRQRSGGGTGAGTRLWPGADADTVCARFSEFERFDVATVPGGLCGYYGYPATQAIRNSNDNYTGYLYGTFDFTDTLQGFASFSGWSSEASAVAATQFWQSPIFFDPRIGRLVDAQRIFTPAEVGGFGAQSQTFEESSTEIAFGLRGELGRFSWEASLGQSQYDIEINRPRFLRQPLFDYFLGPQLGTVSGFPVYEIDYDRYFNPLNPAVYSQLSTMVKTEADSKATTGQFIFSGDLFELPAGAVGMAVAVEAGAQEYTLNPDPRILPGNAEIYNLTGTGGGGERDRYAVGVEFRVPLHETLSVSLAGRYDKYDDVTDVDDAISVNAGIEYRPIDSLLIRGSYATSFRAPDMHFVFADESGFFTGIFDEFNCRADGGDPTDAGGCIEDVAYNYQVFGTRTGSAALEEEEGRSWGAGVVWDITDNFSASLDWYRIELEGAVADISSAYVLREEAACLLGSNRDGSPVDPASAACQFFTSLVTRTVGGPNDGRVEQIRSFPINQSFLANEGLDATISYRYDTENLGTFRLQGSWSHVLKEERELFPGDGIDEDYRDDLLRNPNFRSRARLTGSWAYGDFNTTLAANRLGSFSRYDADGRIAPYITYNASVRYQASENVALTLVGNNILNKRAPRDDSYAAYPYFWYAYSPIGRELFIQLDYRF